MSRFTAGLVVYKTDISELSQLFDLLSQETALSQMIVFDNGNDNQLLAEVSRRGWIYLSEARNIGFGAGHNRILSYLETDVSEYHWIVNPDLEWRSSPTAILMAHLEKHPSCGAVMPDVRNVDGTRQYLAKQLPSPLILLGRRFLSWSKWMQLRIERYEMRTQSYLAPFESPLISGCCFFSRRSVLEKVGGFDERYFLYLEDYDLCRKVWGFGYNLQLVPAAQVIHGHGRASYRFGRALWLHMWSACKYFTKWGWLFDADKKRRY